MTADPLVVGLDLSISATGIAGHDGVCSTAGGGPHLGYDRLAIIRAAVHTAAVTRPKESHGRPVDVVVMESVVAQSVGSDATVATAKVHGAVIHMMVRRSIPFVEVHPSTLKKWATGNGRATKDDMAAALMRRHGLRFDDDNQTDAYWLRDMGIAAARAGALHTRGASAKKRTAELVHWLRSIDYQPEEAPHP